MGLTLALTLHPIRFWATKNPPWFPGRIICLVDSGRAMVTKRRKAGRDPEAELRQIAMEETPSIPS